MPIAAISAMLAEATCVPLALARLAVGVNVEVHALGVAALAVFVKEPTLGHFL